MEHSNLGSTHSLKDNSDQGGSRLAQKAVKTAVKNAAETQQKNGRKAGRKQHCRPIKNTANLFGLCEEALTHFGARTRHKNRAIRIQVHQARPADEAGVESAITVQVLQGELRHLLGFGEEPLTHLCARACDEDSAIRIQVDQAGAGPSSPCQHRLEPAPHMVSNQGVTLVKVWLEWTVHNDGLTC